MRVWIFLGLWVSGFPVGVAAGAGPQVCARIPSDAAAVLLLNHPADSLRAGGAVLERFKSLHPDLDMARLGSKVQAALGENLLTAEGMRAFGLDPDGTVALWAQSFEDDPVLVIPVHDAGLFVQKLQALHKRQSPDAPPGPALVKRSGAEIYEFGGDRVAIRDGWALVLPPAGRSHADPVPAFFGAGRKLADAKPFARALASLPAGEQVIGYLSIEALSRVFEANMAEQIKANNAQLKKASPGSQEWLRQQQTGLQQVRKRTGEWIRQFQALAGGLELGAHSVEATFSAVTQPTGSQALGKIFPAGSGAPAFHAKLASQSVLAGWSGVRFGALLDWLSDLPASPWSLIGAELDQARAEFQRDVGLDLSKDVFGNQREPLVAYFLTPDLSGMKTDDPAPAQFLQLIRFLLVARVSDPAKLTRLFERFDELLRQKGRPFETRPLAGATVRVVRPQAGLEIAWGQKGETAFLGFGPDATAPLAGLDLPGAWAAGPDPQDRGLGRLDFAALGEVLSSAVSKGIGGSAGVQFRMTWPLVQQVFAQFDQLVVRAQVQASGLVLRAALGLR